MKIFVDTEFIDTGREVHLISLGAEREDGRLFYAENAAAPFGIADRWVMEHVVPHLCGAAISTAAMAPCFIEFCGESPTFWGSYAAYDWVLICQLVGPKMIDAPKGWPMRINDVQQLAAHVGFDLSKVFVDEENEHNALQDARYVKRLYDAIIAAETKRATRTPEFA